MPRPSQIAADYHDVGVTILIGIVFVVMVFGIGGGVDNVKMRLLVIVIVDQNAAIWPNIQQQGRKHRH